jgi:hypothetical protein
MLTDAEFALSFLPCLSGPDNGLMATLQTMLCAGVRPELDPFLYSCLHCTRSHRKYSYHVFFLGGGYFSLLMNQFIV